MEMSILILGSCEKMFIRAHIILMHYKMIEHIYTVVVCLGGYNNATDWVIYKQIYFSQL